MLDRINLICYNKIITDLRRYIRRKGIIMKTKYEIVNSYLDSGKKIPKNLTIVLSAWSGWLPENPYHLPTTYVYGKDFRNELIPQDSIPCAGHCDKCQACWQLKKGQSVWFVKH